MSSDPTSSISRRAVLRGAAGTAVAGMGGVALGGRRAPNVLFVVIDDLNDWVGVLGGHKQALTPNIDALAGRGLLFTNAHCAAPACNPSRTAVLTGLRPSTTGVYTNHQPFRRALPDVVTLPQHLRKHGYTTLGCGKVYHAGDPDSWDEADPESGCGWPEGGRGSRPDEKPNNGIRGTGNFDWGPTASRRDGPMSDERVADRVRRWLKRKYDKPFFMACGFFRPHLPWYVPKKYFDLYPLEDVVTPVVKPGDLDDVPDAGRRMVHVEWQETITRSRQWKKAVQGYLASLTFADAQLGRVLERLDDSRHADNTIIVLWTDHGWSLGQKFHWGKFALWEECTRVPLFIAAKGVTKRKTRCHRPVNLVDLYPTITDLCGVPSRKGLDGTSLVPLLQNPEKSWERPSLTTYLRGNHAVRSERYRYIRYADGSEELYDHDDDPHEWTNLAGKSSTRGVREDLARWLPDKDAKDAPEAPEVCKNVED